MKNLGTLTVYEWKKLGRRKILWAALGAAVVVEILVNCIFLMEHRELIVTDENGRSSVVEALGGYEKMMLEQANARALDGRVMDDVLFGEMAASRMQEERHIVMEYDEIYFMVSDVYRGDSRAVFADAAGFYEKWQELMEQNLRETPGLTEGERAWWKAKREEIEVPFTYRYAYSWQRILQCAAATTLLVMLLNAVCLSGVFADEHVRRTDQLILCTQNGRLPVYAAKIIAGGLFGAACALLLYGISFAISFALYGTEGYGAMVQQQILWIPSPMTVGSAVMTLFGLTLLAGVLEAVLAMVLSERLGSSVAVMAVLVSMILINLLVSLPAKWRVLSQIYELFPVRLLSDGSFYDCRLVPLFGGYLTNVRFAALLYPALAILLAFVGKRSYLRYQVTGR